MASASLLICAAVVLGVAAPTSAQVFCELDSGSGNQFVCSDYMLALRGSSCNQTGSPELAKQFNTTKLCSDYGCKQSLCGTRELCTNATYPQGVLDEVDEAFEVCTRSDPCSAAYEEVSVACDDSTTDEICDAKSACNAALLAVPAACPSTEGEVGETETKTRNMAEEMLAPCAAHCAAQTANYLDQCWELPVHGCGSGSTCADLATSAMNACSQDDDSISDSDRSKLLSGSQTCSWSTPCLSAVEAVEINCASYVAKDFCKVTDQCNSMAENVVSNCNGESEMSVKAMYSFNCEPLCSQSLSKINACDLGSSSIKDLAALCGDGPDPYGCGEAYDNAKAYCTSAAATFQINILNNECSMSTSCKNEYAAMSKCYGADSNLACEVGGDCYTSVTRASTQCTSEAEKSTAALAESIGRECVGSPPPTPPPTGNTSIPPPAASPPPPGMPWTYAPPPAWSAASAAPLVALATAAAGLLALQLV